MRNLSTDHERKEFFVWINLNDIMIKTNYEVGEFFSIPENNKKDNLMFLPNPNYGGFVSPFQGNLLRNYLAEYNLEISRRSYYSSYPSRLNALFLFEQEYEAKRYSLLNPDHIANRDLKKVISKNKYILSKHDANWIDFLRLPHSMDQETIHNVCKSYWEGEVVKDCNLVSLGKQWSKEPLFEILYQGNVSFDKSYNFSDVS